MQKKWYSAEETSQYFGLNSRKTLYSLAARKLLPEGSVIKLGRQLRFSIEKIQSEGIKNRKQGDKK
jgi:hypothetical protein